MTRPDYSFEKRQREIAKKRKREEELRRKQEKDATLADTADAQDQG